MTSRLKVEWMIVNHYKQIQNISNSNKLCWYDLLRMKQSNMGRYLSVINYLLKGMQICFYLSTKLSSVVVFDIKI